jgi:hypothetical protein
MSETITYRKTRQGQWVAFAPAATLNRLMLDSNRRIEIVKRSGERKVETLESVGRSFVADGREMAYGYLAKSAPAAPKATPNAGRGGICDECGNPRRNLSACVDSSGIGGMCCPRCASMSPYERSFC